MQRYASIALVSFAAACSGGADVTALMPDKAETLEIERERIFEELRQDTGAVHACEFATEWLMWLSANVSPVWWRGQAGYRGPEEWGDFYEACEAQLDRDQARCIQDALSPSEAECCFAGTALETDYHRANVTCPSVDAPTAEDVWTRLWPELDAIGQGHPCTVTGVWVEILGTVNFNPRLDRQLALPDDPLRVQFEQACLASFHFEPESEMRLHACLAEAFTDREIECCIVGSEAEADPSTPGAHANNDPPPDCG